MVRIEYVKQCNREQIGNYTVNDRIDNDTTTGKKRKVTHCAMLVCRNGQIERCGCECRPYDGSIRVSLPSQTNGVTICSKHAGLLNGSFTANYSSENKNIIGSVNHVGLTISFEFETSYNTEKSIGVCGTWYGLKMLATPDGSLIGDSAIEWKSSIYFSKSGVVKALGTIQYLLDNDFMGIDSDCGTHCHVGTQDNHVDFRTVFPTMREYMQALEPVYDYIYSIGRDKQKRFFGRELTGYARGVRTVDTYDGIQKELYTNSGIGNRYLAPEDNIYGTESYNCTQHLMLLNFQHSYSVECRLFRYRNNEQYKTCILWLQEIVSHIVNYADGSDKTKNRRYDLARELVNVCKSYF